MRTTVVAGLAIWLCAMHLGCSRRSLTWPNNQLSIIAWNDGAVGIRIAVGIPGNSGRPGVVKLLNEELDCLLTVGGSANGSFGWSMCTVGDSDDDGSKDLLVGAPALGDGATGKGSVFRVSVRSGHIVDRLDGSLEGEQFGYEVAAVGDIDGDGHEDYAVGAPGQAVGRCYLFSGDANRLIRSHGYASARGSKGRFGCAVTQLNDIDGDGVPEYAIGSWGEAAVRVFSGKSGAILRYMEEASVWSWFGWDLAFVPATSAGQLNSGQLYVSSPGTADYSLWRVQLQSGSVEACKPFGIRHPKALALASGAEAIIIGAPGHLWGERVPTGAVKVPESTLRPGGHVFSLDTSTNAHSTILRASGEEAWMGIAVAVVTTSRGEVRFAVGFEGQSVVVCEIGDDEDTRSKKRVIVP